MPGPPEDIPPSELWLALTQIPRPHRLVDVPRYLPGTSTPVGQVAMWPLTQEEQMAVNAAADKFTKELLKDPQRKEEANLGYEHTYSNEVAVQILYRVCRVHDDLKKPAFPSPKLMRMTFTADEIGLLFKEYLTVQLELGPIVAYMSPEDQELWIRRIAEGGSSYPFEQLSWDAQRILVRSMACQLVSFWTATSSAGSPPTDSSPEQSPDDPPPVLEESATTGDGESASSE